MVLLFLKDLRSVAIVLVNIPLALMFSLFALWISKQTINVMTLGGLALAVGILVDETTVTIENIHTHMARGKSPSRAALDAAIEILKPALLTLLCVLTVFLPSFYMEGVAKALFVPLTLAVGFAMTGSFILSMMLVPVLCAKFLRESPHIQTQKAARVSFQRLHDVYGVALNGLMRFRRVVVPVYILATLVLTAFLVVHVGREIFPIVDEGQFKVRIRAPSGTRLDVTEGVVLKVLDIIRGTVGEEKIHKTLAFVGQQPPEYPINDVYEWTSGTQEAVLQVAMKQGSGVKIEKLKETLRKSIRDQLPDVESLV